MERQTMRHAAAIPILLALWAFPTEAQATSAQRDAHMDHYLAIWSRDSAVTPATVGRLYGRSVVYYGRPMSAAAVYRDKLAFIRSWPVRAYDTVPGSVTNDCSDTAVRCRVTALLRWHRADAAGRDGQDGTSSIRLDLVREDGTLKIVRESGAPAGARR